MNDGLECVLTRYEQGQLSRRELLAALGAMLVARPAAAAAVTAAPRIGAVRQLNHVTVLVQDVPRSVAFYQRLFDMPVLTYQPPGVNLSTGTGFLGIYPAKGRPSEINHLCLGLEHFDADTVLKALQAEGLDARIHERGETKELSFVDPDGLRIQLQDVGYIGGIGPLGDRDPGPA